MAHSLKIQLYLDTFHLAIAFCEKGRQPLFGYVWQTFSLIYACRMDAYSMQHAAF